MHDLASSQLTKGIFTLEPLQYLLNFGFDTKGGIHLRSIS